ncbi:MAG: hypothetical protein CGW95_05865 [Phenylobacterium zucineum]|nr:MAG: hypothetical protein CGW95_05865 [Phenylobacterium zucineum]
MIAKRQFAQKPGRYVNLLAGMTISAILLSVVFLLWGLHDRELSRGRQETVNLAHIVLQQTERQFDSIDLVLTGVQERLQTPFGKRQKLGGDSVRLLLNSRVAGLSHVHSLFILDAEGRLVNASRNFEAEGTAMANAAVFQAFVHRSKNRLYIDQPSVGDDAGWVLHLARPLLNEKGTLRGVVVAAVGLSSFEHLYSAMQFDYVRPIGFYLADGTRLAGWPPHPDSVGKKAVEWVPKLPEAGQPMLSVSHKGEAGERRFTSLSSLAGYPILVSVTDDEYLSLALWRETAWPIATGALLVSIFIALLAVYLVGKLRLKEQLTQALNAADQRYQHTVNSVMDAIVAVDESMQVVLFNPSAENMFGYDAASVLGRPLDMLIPQRLRSIHDAHVLGFSDEDSASRATALQADIVGLRSDGLEFPLESTISRSVIGGRMQLTAVLRDASERRRVENELRLANGQLRELSASLQSVREEERKRISRELHDDLGQQLTGLKLSLSWLGSRLKDGKPTTVSDVDEMRHQMDAAITSVRRLATELRPRVLDDVDFKEALTWQSEEFIKHSGLQIKLDLQDADRVADDQLATALFRIVQEALTNVVRHSKATEVQVSLQLQDDSLRLVVSDNGQGFEAGTSGGGVGLVSMRERCAAIGARFVVHSSIGAGSRIEVHVPWLQNLVRAADSEG